MIETLPPLDANPLTIPFYKRTHRTLALGLFLLLVYLLLLMTGLGIFRLYFAFDWAPDSQSDRLFNMSIYGGQSLNVFEAKPFGQLFWLSQACLIVLAFCMPFFRVAGALVLATIATAAVVTMHLRLPASSTGTPLEFELLMLLVLVLIYLLLAYIASVRDHKKVSSLLSKFVPREVSDQYQHSLEPLSLAGEEREISVLFCDIRGFSSTAQELDSAQLATWLNEYFTLVSKIVVRYRGSIDKYMGDSVMAVWGAPIASQTHAYDALQAALDIRQELRLLNDSLEARLLPTISIGIGISTGLALVGPLGSEHRMDYTVIGETVNVAQSLERQTRKYHVPIIVGDSTVEDHSDLLFRELDTVKVKGREEPVTIYEPLCAVADANELLLEHLATHERAMTAASSGEWESAAELFTQLRDDWGPAKMYDIYLKGIEQARS